MSLKSTVKKLKQSIRDSPELRQAVIDLGRGKLDGIAWYIIVAIQSLGESLRYLDLIVFFFTLPLPLSSTDIRRMYKSGKPSFQRQGKQVMDILQYNINKVKTGVNWADVISECRSKFSEFRAELTK